MLVLELGQVIDILVDGDPEVGPLALGGDIVLGEGLGHSEGTTRNRSSRATKLKICKTRNRGMEKRENSDRYSGGKKERSEDNNKRIPTEATNALGGFPVRGSSCCHAHMFAVTL